MLQLELDDRDHDEITETQTVKFAKTALNRIARPPGMHLDLTSPGESCVVRKHPN